MRNKGKDKEIDDAGNPLEEIMKKKGEEIELDFNAI